MGCQGYSNPKTHLVNPVDGQGQNGTSRTLWSPRTGYAPHATKCQNTATPIAITVNAPSVVARNRGVASAEPTSGIARPTSVHGSATASQVVHSQIQNAGDSNIRLCQPENTSRPCIQAVRRLGRHARPTMAASPARPTARRSEGRGKRSV